VKVAGALVLLVLSLCAAAAEPKRVLIIHSFGRDFAPFNTIAPALRTELARNASAPVIFSEMSLDAERGGASERERPFVDFLLERYGATRPDLVVTVGAPALRFYLRNRSRLFPAAPLLAAGADQRVLERVKLEPRDRAVSVRLDFPQIAGNILRVLPETTTLAVVVGSSPLERFWLNELKTDLAPLAGRVRLLWLTDLTLAQLRERVAALPPGSAVFYGVFAADANGVPYENEQALAAVRAASSAPVFGAFESQLGEGIVGGPLLDLRKVGTVSGQAADRMLQAGGEDAGASLVMAANAPVFDWREMKRWGIADSLLPAGSEVRFSPPSIWEEHRALIVAGIGIVLLQAALITGLLLERLWRRRAEAESVDLTGRLLTAHEDERRHLARELHDDLTQRLARLAIDAGQIERGGISPPAGAVRALREELVRLSEDVHALSYRLHPSVLDDLGLVEALRTECDRVSRHGGMQVDFDARGVPKTLPLDTSLCLFRVAQEALSNATRHAGAHAVKVALGPSRAGLRLAVSDDGAGFEPARRSGHASLGLASMRERVRLLEGDLDIESAPGRGTTVLAWVPAGRSA